MSMCFSSVQRFWKGIKKLKVDFFFSCTKCAKKRVSERAGPKILADHERGCFDKLEWKLLWEPAEPVRK